MKKFNYSNTGFGFAFPDEWHIDKDENVISLYDPIKGVGTLQFSIYRINEPKNINLKEELEDSLRGHHEKYSVSVFNNYVTTDYLSDGKRIWKYWLFLNGRFLIFGTYNCNYYDQGKENKVIREIINTIVKS